MAHPIYFRSPFGAMKRLKISPQCGQRSSTHICYQRAGLADVREVSPQTSKPPQDSAEETKSIDEIASSQAGSQVDEEGSRPLWLRRQPPGFKQLYNLDPRTKELLYQMNLPPNVQSVYLRPLRRAPTHGVPVCDLQLRSYSVRNLEFFADFAMRAAYYLGLPAKGPVPLPQITERWTVPRGPFVHKKSQENFERKTLRRLIQLQDGHPEVVQAWLAYLERRAYYGVGMKANVFEWDGLDVAKEMDKNAGAIAEEAEEMYSNFGLRESSSSWTDATVGKQALSDLLTLEDDVRRKAVEIEGRS